MATGNSKPSPLLDAVAPIELGNERSLLDQIDQLRHSRVDHYVKLPQIVVVGDQSAGKSSVLEAITNLPFPRSESKCTRFATEIRLRRAPEKRQSISIIPGKNQSANHRARIARFNETVDHNSAFSNLMEDAIEAMNLKSTPDRFTSNDILRVEVSGPTQSHLTIVDLPGFIQTSNPYQSQEDVDGIAEIARQYMKNSRTIILAIVSAAYDYANQSVVKKARDVDPTGTRTIGVITKPDKAEATRVDEFVALAKDMHIKLNLGWHVLRNRTFEETNFSAEQRKHTEMQFFTNDKWRTLKKSDVGIDNLRVKLSHQLQRHIKNEIPKVQKEIVQMIEECNKDLTALGEGKDTVEEMRVELLKLCSKSRELTDLAVNGQYKNPIGLQFFPHAISKNQIPIRKLRACVIEQNIRFAQDISLFGQTVDLTDDADTQSRHSNAQELRERRRMTRDEYIREEVQPLIKQSIGEELPGDSNPLLVYDLFQGYSADWPIYAQAHKKEVEKLCEQFITEVIEFVWPEYMRENLKLVLLERHINRRLKGAEHEARQIYSDRERYIRTYDPDFQERVRSWRQDSSPSLEEADLEAEEYLQKMLIFYDLTSKTFINNIIVQVIERHLLYGLGTIFDLAEVSILENARVEQIAAENEYVRRTRADLKKKKIILEDGFSICRNIAANRDLGSFHVPEQKSPAIHTAPQKSIDASSSDEETKSPRRRRPVGLASPTQGLEQAQEYIDSPETNGIPENDNDARSPPRTSRDTPEFVQSVAITPDRRLASPPPSDPPTTAYQSYWRAPVEQTPPVTSPPSIPTRELYSPRALHVPATPPVASTHSISTRDLYSPRVPQAPTYTPAPENPVNEGGRQPRRKMFSGLTS